VAALDALDLPIYDIELTLFFVLLLGGKKAEFWVDEREREGCVHATGGR
jgi:hypothetical protein